MAPMFFSGIFFTLFTCVFCSSPVFLTTDPSIYDPSDVIERDVVVIGGGSSGTYTSVRLRDHNKSVAVIEKKAALGGHAEAWLNKLTGQSIDIGVVVFANTDTVNNYFSRFNLSLVPVASAPAEYADFSTGKVADFIPPSQEALGAALAVYTEQMNKHSALQNGFIMDYPVDPDLLLSFRDFVAKYNLQDMVPQTFAINQGYAPLLDISMLYIFKYLNANEIRSLQEGLLTTAHHSTVEFYQKAAEFLGSDVFLSSTILKVDRSCGGQVRVLLQTPVGRKLVIGKKMVSTIPPLIDNLGPFDLSPQEVSLFGQFFANGYYTGLLNNTGLNISLLATGPNRQYNVPDLPGPYAMWTIGSGIVQTYYGSPSTLEDSKVQADIMSTVKRIQKESGLPATEPEWLTFSSHSPFNLMVSNQAIQDRFYESLYYLQGQHDTFYNGAAWHTQDSSALWEFTDNFVLPRLLASL